MCHAADPIASSAVAGGGGRGAWPRAGRALIAVGQARTDAGVAFSWAEADDGMACAGQVEFDGADAAKAAIEKYDGVDMGLGTTLSLRAL